MPIVMVHDSPGVTQEQYEQVGARLTDGHSLKALNDWPVAGILSHTAGPTADGWRVIDVWESEEAYQRFGDMIGPVLQELDYPGQPQIFEVHNFVK